MRLSSLSNLPEFRHLSNELKASLVFLGIADAREAIAGDAAIQKVEAGDANVSIGLYAAVLEAPGLLDDLGEIADIAPRQRRPVFS